MHQNWNLLQHWGKDRVDYIGLNFTNGNKVEFAQSLNEMKQSLVHAGIIEDKVPDPAVRVELNVQHAAVNRPGIVRHEFDKEPNPNYPVVDFDLLANLPHLLQPTAELPLDSKYCNINVETYLIKKFSL